MVFLTTPPPSLDGLLFRVRKLLDDVSRPTALLCCLHVRSSRYSDSRVRTPLVAVLADACPNPDLTLEVVGSFVGRVKGWFVFGRGVFV